MRTNYRLMFSSCERRNSATFRWHFGCATKVEWYTCEGSMVNFFAAATHQARRMNEQRFSLFRLSVE